LSNIETAIVLGGGFATRLRPLTLTKPKPLLPILDLPLMDWILRNLAEAGVKEIILSLRYLADMIKARYEEGEALGVKIHYAEEIKPLGDGGPIPLIQKEYDIDGPFLTVYGDIFSNINFKEIITFHKKKGGLLTLALTKVENPSRYGVAVLNSDSQILKFIEKPGRDQFISNLINAGVYVFEPEAVRKYFPNKTPISLSREVVPKLVKEGVAYGYVHRGIWHDIGVPRDYLIANIDALNNFTSGTEIKASAKISERTEIIPPVYIGKNVVIEEGSVIGPEVIIGRGSVIGPNTRILSSVIMSNVVTEGASFISGSIIGDKTYLGRWVWVSDGNVLGDDVVVKDGVYLARGVKILPYKEITSSIYEEGKVVL